MVDAQKDNEIFFRLIMTVVKNKRGVHRFVQCQLGNQ
jgi:hypothetical protein